MDATDLNPVSSAREFSRQNLLLILQAQERLLRLLAHLGLAPAPAKSASASAAAPATHNTCPA